MSINTKDIGFVKFNSEEMQWVKFNGVTVYEAWKSLIASGVPPLTIKSKGEDLINYTITCNSVQIGDKTRNLLDDSNICEIKIASDKTRYGFDFGVLPAGDYNFHFELGEGETFSTYLYFYKQGSDDEYPTSDSNHNVTTNEIRRNPMKFTVDGATRCYLLCASNSVSNIDRAINNLAKGHSYMLEAGSTKHEYERYGYKIPIQVTPTIYDFNPEKIELYQISDTDTKYGFDLGVLEAGEHTINIDFIDPKKITEYLYLRCRYSDGTYSESIHVTAMTTNYSPRSFVADGSSHYYLYFASRTVNSLELAKMEWQKVKNAYLQKGSTFERYTTNIYIDEPLKENESISYVEDNLPTLSTFKGTNIIEVDTKIQPSNLEVAYKGKE